MPQQLLALVAALRYSAAYHTTQNTLLLTYLQRHILRLTRLRALVHRFQHLYHSLADLRRRPLKILIPKAPLNESSNRLRPSPALCTVTTRNLSK